MATTLRLTGGYLEQSVGTFGSYGNLPVPAWVTIVWGLCAVAATVVALAFSPPCRRALPVLGLAIVAFTIVLEAPKLNAVGNYFSARYILPLLIGFPLVASSFEWRGRRELSRRSATIGAVVVGGLLLVAQLTAFHGALQAYRAAAPGIGGIAAHWSPPGGIILVEGLFALGALVTLSLVLFMVSGGGDRLVSGASGRGRPIEKIVQRS